MQDVYVDETKTVLKWKEKHFFIVRIHFILHSKTPNKWGTKLTSYRQILSIKINLHGNNACETWKKKYNTDIIAKNSVLEFSQ